MTDNWTFETLRIYLESRVEALGDRLTAAIDEIRRSAGAAAENASAAIVAAKAAQDVRLAGLNELRDLLDKILNQAMPRVEADAKFDDVVKDLRQLEKRFAAVEGRGQGFHRGWIYLLGFLGAAGTILGIYAALKVP